MKGIIRFFTVIILLAVTVGYCYLENREIEVTEIAFDADIPPSFDNYTIAQVSDLHNTEFGENHAVLLEKIQESQPNIIVVTGDLIDSRRTKCDVALSFVSKALEIAPVYYVMGNHETRVSEYTFFKEGLRSLGVVVLENSSVYLTEGEERLRLVGINDPDGVKGIGVKDSAVVKAWLHELEIVEEEYTILLSHRPELLDEYAESKVDLVFCGHAHGGQVRLPFLGGVVAPDQGLFPKYTRGVYEKGATKMVVSRGLGNSLFPFRINNNPELVVVTLKSK